MSGKSRRKKRRLRDQRAAQQSQPVVTFEAKSVGVSFSGPLPPPQILKGFDEVRPGCADTIVKMAQDQASHRRDLESKVVNTNSKNSTLGIVCGFVLALVIIASGSYLIYQDKDVQGLAMIGGSIAALVSVFVYGRRAQRMERRESIEPLQNP